jgi:hypothetical protein
MRARILAGLGQAARRRTFAAMLFDRALRSPLNRLRDISISLVGLSRSFRRDRAVSLTDTLTGRLSSA